MKFYLILFMLSATLLIGCVSNKYKECPNYLDYFNRSMYNFNYNVLDYYLVYPVAIVWRNYIPYPVRNGINNILNNFEEPAIMVNYFLRGDPYNGMIHFTRFFLNTILGIGGFIDLASLANKKLQRKQPQRFGSTLGYYGVNYGPYIHLPFYGSFTFRVDIGNIVDTFYPALSWLNLSLYIGKWILEGIEVRIRFMDYDIILCNSSDPYIMLREIYFQKNDFLANEGKLKSENNIEIIESEISEIDSD